MDTKILDFIKKYIYRSFLNFSLLFSLLLVSSPSLYALAPPVELHLNTTIEAVSNFVLAEDDVIITLGDTREVAYTFTGNFPVKLAITSDHSVGTQFYMVHEDPSFTDKIPYSLQFNYGEGTFSAVLPTTPRNITGFNTTTGYNLSSHLNIITTASSADELSEGEYSDTLTFSFTAQ